MIRQLYRGDLVRLRADMPSHWSSGMRIYLGNTVTIDGLYYPQFDNASHAFDYDDIIEVLPRTTTIPPSLQAGDFVVLTSDTTQQVSGGWNSDMRRDYSGQTALITGFSGNDYMTAVRDTERRPSAWNFPLSSIVSVVPRPDGTMPAMPYFPKVGDAVLLVGTDAIPEGGVTIPGWDASMNRYLDSVVTVGRVADGAFRIQGTERDTQYTFRFTNVVRKATEEDIANWKVAVEEKRLKMEELLKTAVHTPEAVGALANFVFGEEFVEVSATPGGFNLTIHFPEIDITNSLAQNHRIHDIFIRYKVKETVPEDGYLLDITMLGGRTTYTLPDLHSNYIHSHLRSGIKMPFDDESNQKFCLGSSEYKIVIENTKLYAQELDWMTMFFGLKNYLSWESLEGGPHIALRNISSGSSGSSTKLSDAQLSPHIDKLLEKLPLELWEYSPNGFLLNPDNPEVIEYFTKNSKIKSLITEAAAGGTAADNIRRNKDKRFVFKGKNFQFRIYHENKEEAVSDGKTVEPELIKAYCRILFDRISSFNKTYIYELRKSECSDTFAAARVLQQA